MSGKRKSAVARAAINDGSGIVKINGQNLESYNPLLSRQRIQEPLLLAGDLIKNLNIEVITTGGGFSSQAEAARLAVAKAIVQHTKDKKLKEIYLKYDRHLLVADVRRKEPKKPNCHSKARSKRQKSYR